MSAQTAAAAPCEQWRETQQPGRSGAPGRRYGAPALVSVGEALQVEIQHLGSTRTSVVE